MWEYTIKISPFSYRKREKLYDSSGLWFDTKTLWIGKLLPHMNKLIIIFNFQTRYLILMTLNKMLSSQFIQWINYWGSLIPFFYLVWKILNYNKFLNDCYNDWLYSTIYVDRGLNLSEYYNKLYGAIVPYVIYLNIPINKIDNNNYLIFVRTCSSEESRLGSSYDKPVFVKVLISYRRGTITYIWNTIAGILPKENFKNNIYSYDNVIEVKPYNIFYQEGPRSNTSLQIRYC